MYAVLVLSKFIDLTKKKILSFYFPLNEIQKTRNDSKAYQSSSERWHTLHIHTGIHQPFNTIYMVCHFLPPGVACTTGLSHYPFTWRLL